MNFGQAPTFVSDLDLVVSVSPDKQAFTLTASNAEVAVGDGRPETIATHLFSMTMPVEEATIGTEIVLMVSGYAFVTEGATGLATITINGQAKTEILSPVMDNEFVYKFRVDGTHASECRLSLCLVAERERNRPDAISRFNVLSIDAEIHQPASVREPVG